MTGFPGSTEFAEWQERMRREGERKLTEAMGQVRHRYLYDAEFHARVHAVERALADQDLAAGLRTPERSLTEALAFVLQVDDMIRSDLEARRV